MVQKVYTYKITLHETATLFFLGHQQADRIEHQKAWGTLQETILQIFPDREAGQDHQVNFTISYALRVGQDIGLVFSLKGPKSSREIRGQRYWTLSKGCRIHSFCVYWTVEVISPFFCYVLGTANLHCRSTVIQVQVSPVVSLFSILNTFSFTRLNCNSGVNVVLRYAVLCISLTLLALFV